MPTRRSAADQATLARLGDTIRARRHAASLSQRALASAAHTTARHVVLVESGRNEPGVLMLARLAHALGCSSADLLGA